MNNFNFVDIDYNILIADTEEGQNLRESLLDYYIDNSTFGRSSYGQRDNNDILKNYQYYNGQIPYSEYAHVLNPYNTTNPDYKRYPAKLKNHNIIKPVVRLLLSEGNRRPRNFTVFSANPDSVNAKKEFLLNKVKNTVKDMFINELIRLGVIQGEEVETLPLENIEELAYEKYDDWRAAKLQQGVNYVINFTKFWNKSLEALKHWLIAGEVYSYKEIINGEIQWTPIHPMHLDYDRSHNSIFVEKGDWVVHHTFMKLSEVIEKFAVYLTKEEVAKLITNADKGSGGSVYQDYSPDDDWSARHTEEVVAHASFKVLKKLYTVEYFDENTQNVEKFTVEQDKWPGKKVIKDVYGKEVHITYQMIEEVWAGYRLGGDGDYVHKNIGPIEFQRRASHNYAECLLPYNGIKMNDLYTEVTSIPKEGMVYQLLYNILHWRWEMAIAKYKGAIIVMDIESIPTKKGWDMEKFLYTLDASSIAVVTTRDEDGQYMPNVNQKWHVLNTEQGQYIVQLYTAIQLIKEEWENSLGINNQRKGQTGAHEKVTNAQQNIVQSSLMTEEIFRLFEEWIGEELTGIMDLIKHAWPEGKTTMYPDENGKINTLEITGEQMLNIQESSVGLFINNSGKELEKLELLRNAAIESTARHGGSIKTLADILDSDNFAIIKMEMKKVEDAAMKAAQAQQQAEQEAALQIAQMEANEKEKDRQIKLEIAHLDADTKLIIAGNDSNMNMLPDTTEIEKLSNERMVKQQELTLEAERVKNEKETDKKELALKDKELNIKDKEIDTNLKIAKENKNKHDA